MRRLIASTLIAAAVAVGVLALRAIPVASIPIRLLDETLYDSLYRLRPLESRENGEVVIIAADDQSNAALNEMKGYRQGWPWPRVYWGSLAEYLCECHAKAIVFDILFDDRGRSEEDNLEFAKALDRARNTSASKFVFASGLDSRGKRTGFFPPAKTPPPLGITSITDDAFWRTYAPQIAGRPSLALEALGQAGLQPKLPIDRPFRLHFYGPHDEKDGRYAFRIIPAGTMVIVANDPDAAPSRGIDPRIFRDKIVLIGATMQGAYDLKAMPLSARYPGVELHATAIENLLHGDQVTELGTFPAGVATLLTAWFAAAGAVVPRRASVKLLLVLLAMTMLLGVAVKLFVRHDIIWLPLAAPLLAAVLASVGALAWSYFGEDRQRRQVLKALSAVVAPYVAEELARDPEKLSRVGERREMTVMFTDIRGFTDLCEALPFEKLKPLLNCYLEEMSDVVISESGTLVQYIGDAIMSFWNAPLPQKDHAVLACRAALRMAHREADIQPRLRELGVQAIFTRIGVNTGPMAVGFTGSSRLMNYTALGDAVNFGARLEGTNKFYGTQIIISRATARRVRRRFVLRMLDVLRVKGKKKPSAVYELIGEAPCDAPTHWKLLHYVRAWRQYRRQRWDRARGLLVELLARYPDDGPAKTLMARVAQYRIEPPPADWDGVHEMKEK